MKQFKFKATIQSAGGGGACVLFPYYAEKEFATKGRVPVKVTFDGVAYAGSLVKYGKPQHMLPILKAIRDQIGKQPGDCVQVELWKDEAERTLDVPAPFAALLKKEKLLPVLRSSATRTARSIAAGSPRPRRKRRGKTGWRRPWRCCAKAQRHRDKANGANRLGHLTPRPAFARLKIAALLGGPC